MTRGWPAIAVEHVWVRGVSRTFPNCLRTNTGQAIDLAAACAQHQGYVDALRAAGCEVRQVPEAHDAPDAVFVEDSAVILDREHVLLTRPGAPSRRAEVPGVRAALGAALGAMIVHEMAGPATLDGGDVLRAGPHLFVGLSERTNQAGFERLAALAEARGLQASAIPLARGLHLKSACSLADAGTLVYDPAVLPAEPFEAVGLTCLATEEPFGANLLALGSGQVLVSADSPKTADVLRARGLHVTAVRISQMHAADGALTCLSLRIPTRAGWCT